jgi:hypothetical protein
MLKLIPKCPHILKCFHYSRKGRRRGGGAAGQRGVKRKEKLNF